MANQTQISQAEKRVTTFFKSIWADCTASQRQQFKVLAERYHPDLKAETDGLRASLTPDLPQSELDAKLAQWEDRMKSLILRTRVSLFGSASTKDGKRRIKEKPASG